jgi:phospholipid/cholesterol/gamma-HCH transport system substrate-binding protein
MRDTWRAAKVGIMVVAGLVAIFLVYRYVEETAGGGEGNMVCAMFDDAQGLIPKSRVVIAGIPVGQIEDIYLEGNRARVDMMIDESVELHADSSVAMRSVSILGESILVINPGSVDEPRLAAGECIPQVQEQVSTDEILQNVNEIAKNVRSVTEQLDRAFGTDEAGQRMESALRNLSEALEAINRTIAANEQAINRIIANIDDTAAAAGPRLIRILDNVEVASADVRDLIHDNRDNIDGALDQIDETVASINGAATELQEVLADAGVVTDRLVEGEGTLGRLSEDETLIDEVEGAAEGINNLVGGLARLQTIVELRSEYNFLANSFKSYVSIRLQPREDRYYLIQLIDDPRGNIDVTETTVRTSPPREGEAPIYQETRVTRSDALRFTFQFAKRIHFATFRFGIMESTGGLGVDFHLADDRLEMNLDAFAVGEQTFPRLRFRIAYEVVSRLWVLGGIDDALNGSRDFFLGAMLRFNDEDLKGILPFAGGAVLGAATQ